MDVTRRQLVAIGATGAAGAFVGKVAASEPAVAAGQRVGGVHINVSSGAVEGAPRGFPYHWTVTVYGPDSDLSGMGWGGTFEGDREDAEDVVNSRIAQSVYAVRGAIQGDTVTLDGPIVFSGSRILEGQVLHFEGNLTTGFLHISGPHPDGPLVFEGTGTIFRI